MKGQYHRPHHTGTPRAYKIYRCKLCDKRFWTLGELHQHKDTKHLAP